MDESQVRLIFAQMLRETGFGVPSVPFHKHTGTDSPTLDNNAYINGTAQMALGTVTITDPRITTSSTIVATPTTSTSLNSFPAYTFGALCAEGTASIFDNSLTNNQTFNYIIIF